MRQSKHTTEPRSRVPGPKDLEEGKSGVVWCCKVSLRKVQRLSCVGGLDLLFPPHHHTVCFAAYCSFRAPGIRNIASLRTSIVQRQWLSYVGTSRWRSRRSREYKCTCLSHDVCVPSTDTQVFSYSLHAWNRCVIKERLCSAVGKYSQP